MARGMINIAAGTLSDVTNEPDYSALLCSLPHLKDPFTYQAQSISFVQLRKRMNMLEGNDYDRIRDIRYLFYWGGLPLAIDEKELVERARRFVDSLPYPEIREWLHWRMDLRVILAALRKRKQGQSSPAESHWSFGDCEQQIQRYWSSPCFRFEHRYPFLKAAAEHLEQGESYELERLLLTSIWHYYAQQSPTNDYGFSAVVLYVMKWDLVNRWQQYDVERAKQRFETLIQDSYPQLNVRAG